MMILKTIILILIGLATTLSTLTAQQITKEDRKYLYEDELYDCNEIGVILRSNKKATIEYKKYKSSRSSARILGFTGLTLIGAPLLIASINNERHESPTNTQILSFWSVLIGAALVVLSLPSSIISKMKFNNAIKAFNNSDISYRPRQGTTLHLGAQEHGIGIGVVF